ncbi:unnamed protein product [Somion occarium]|uniref:AB hydrolase-1 domain-containing protein n=1 Tax=Somion occarium TaxID=3059160 RepID=A0ABP1E030_9APHY
MTTQGKFVASNDGTKIWADASGNPSKPAVVFIHGLGCTSVAFDKQFTDKNLLDNLYLVRYEMRGHGRSDHPATAEAHTSIRYAEDFKAVNDAFGLNKPIILGWSLGMIPVDVIEAYGAKTISGVILPGGPAITRALHDEYFHPELLRLFPLLMDSSGDSIGNAASAFVDSCVADPAAMPFETKLQWMGGFAMQSPTVRALCANRAQPSDRWEKEIHDVPVLLIQGDQDTHADTEKMVPIARKYFPKLDLHIFEGVGHAPFYERPTETNELILDFVGRVVNGRT